MVLIIMIIIIFLISIKASGSKDEKGKNSDIFYQPTDTNQIFPLTIKSSDTIDIVVPKIHRLVSVHSEGFDSDLIEDRSKEFVITIV